MWGVVGLAGLLTGCADTGYLWQSVRGHMAVLQAVRPVDDWLADPTTADTTLQQLQQTQSMRRFASQVLALPDNASYSRYADIGRASVVWNVVAAPVDSLQPKTWCFPVAGCVGYRGYYQEADARALAQELAQQGWEVWVYGVPAYSTLGKLNLLGGDPILSTWLPWPAPERARLLFHELAHQVVYVAGDTRFNESFATAVERLGLQAWLPEQASAAEREVFAQREARRLQFAQLTQGVRAELQAIYRKFGKKKPQVQKDDELIALKNKAMQDFRQAYAALRTQWGGYAGYDAWVAGANNAALALQASYTDAVPGFERLFAQHHGRWPDFFAAVQQLAQRSRAERDAALGVPPPESLDD